MAAVPTTTAAKVIHAGGGWAEELADGLKYPYHYQFTYNTGHQGEAVVRHVLDVLKLKKIGILQENSGFGESAAAATVRALKKRGLEPARDRGVPAQRHRPEGVPEQAARRRHRSAGAVEHAGAVHPAHPPPGCSR